MIKTWKKPPLEAASVTTGRCPDCGQITLVFEAEDETAFAVGHVTPEGIDDLIEQLRRARTGH